MKTMRKLGGWWRLWIAVSGLWLTAAAIFSISLSEDLSAEGIRSRAVQSACWRIQSFSDAEIEQASKIEGKSPSQGHWVLELSETKAAAQDADLKRIVQAGDSFPNVAKECVAAKRADYSDQVESNREAFAATIFFSGVIPPLILLILGLLVRWVFKGFYGGEQ